MVLWKMCDSDDPGDHARSGLDLTGFLFGNIDESGQLEDDGLLDGDSKRMLSSLNRLGLGSMLSEVLEGEEPSKDDEEKGFWYFLFRKLSFFCGVSIIINTYGALLAFFLVRKYINVLYVNVLK